MKKLNLVVENIRFKGGLELGDLEKDANDAMRFESLLNDLDAEMGQCLASSSVNVEQRIRGWQSRIAKVLAK